MTARHEAPATAALRAALSGAAPERPLLAPRFSAVVGEVEGLTPRAVLQNPTKLTNLLRDVQRGLGVDVVWAESGSLIEMEAMGARLDWASFPPRPLTPPVAGNPQGQRWTALTDVIARLRTMLGERVAVGVALSGPIKLSRLSSGAVDLGAAASMLIPLVRTLCEAGVNLLLLVEDSEHPPENAGAYAATTAPLYATARFYQCVPALSLSGSADAWVPVIQALGTQAVPCFNPIEAPNLASRASRSLFGLALPSNTASDPALSSVLQGGRCLMVTTDDELSGRVPIQALKHAVADLRRLVL